MFEIIEPGTFIGMKSPPDATEPFFLAEILRKGTAEEVPHDANRHIILECRNKLCWKIKEGKKLFKYKQLWKPCSVFIYFYEIFITNVALGENLSMSIDEYQLLLVDALSDYVL